MNPHVPLPFPLDISQRGYAPVGRLGVEPSDTALSGRPRRPAGSRPPRGRWRCRAPRPVRAAAGFQGPLPRRRRTFQALARHCGGRYALPVTPSFEAGSAAHSRITLTCQERRTRIPALCARPPAFETEPAPWRVRSPGNGRGRSARCPAPSGAHAASNRSRHPGRFILQGVQLTAGCASPQGHAAAGWTAYCTSAIRRRSCWPAVQRKASDSNATGSPRIR